jgi:hypothetical protein
MITIAENSTDRLTVRVTKDTGKQSTFNNVVDVRLADGRVYILRMKSGAVYTYPATAELSIRDNR